MRKALLCGVNDYAPVGAGGPDLRGCVNDVKDAASTFNAMGIVPLRPMNMRILTDARATRANILAGLKWLVTGAKKGDLLIFYYSGHGSQVADVSGDEIDRKDETICPHDYATAGMIRDDDLRNAFKGVAAGVNLEVLLDSCHSGTGTRELNAISKVPAGEEVTYRYIEPPVDYGFFLDADPSIPRKGLLKRGEGEKEMVIVPGLNHVLWAACHDFQLSMETNIGGAVRGVFTYSYFKVLRRVGLGVTRLRLDSLVTDYMRRQGFGQHPQLEATKETMSEKVFT